MTSQKGSCNLLCWWGDFRIQLRLERDEGHCGNDADDGKPVEGVPGNGEMVNDVMDLNEDQAAWGDAVARLVTAGCRLPGLLCRQGINGAEPCLAGITSAPWLQNLGMGDRQKDEGERDNARNGIAYEQRTAQSLYGTEKECDGVLSCGGCAVMRSPHLRSV